MASISNDVPKAPLAVVPKRKGVMSKREDRRTRYTKGVIHEAFFELLHQKGFARTSVTDVCRRAQINRGTFYLHYEDKYALLDEVIDEALDADPPLGGGAPTSMCQKAPVNDDYRMLYAQPDLFSRVAERVVERGAAQMVPQIMERTGLSEQDARLLFVFTAHGNLAVNRLLGWRQDARFLEVQELIGRFVAGGYTGLSPQGRGD